MQTPNKISRPGAGAYDALVARIVALENALAAVSRKTLYSMTVGDANGIHIDIGPNGSPEINLYPDTSGVHAQLKTFPSTDPSGNPTPEILLDVQNASDIQDGGTLRLYSQGAAFGVLEAAGPTSFLYFDNNMNLQFQGGFAPTQNWSGLAGIYFTEFNAGGGGSGPGGPYTYGPTYATQPYVFLGDNISGGTVPGTGYSLNANGAPYCSAESTTGFSTWFQGNGVHNLRVWAVRFN